MPTCRRFLAVFSALLSLLLLHSLGFGQSASSVITGNVKDSTGKPVPFANITLVSAIDTNSVKNIAGNAAGRYRLAVAQAGKFRLTASYGSGITRVAAV